MKKIAYMAALLVSGLLLLAANAQAQTAYITTNANLRAGPDVGYPRVLTVPSGVSVQIYGCINDWSWCDIAWRGQRGWISGALLGYNHSGRRVPVSGYGAQLGLPIVSFVFDSYWNDHYRNSAWYGNRDRWRTHQPGKAVQRQPQAQRPQQNPRQQAQRPQQNPKAQAQRPQQNPKPQAQSGKPPATGGKDGKPQPPDQKRPY